MDLQKLGCWTVFIVSFLFSSLNHLCCLSWKPDETTRTSKSSSALVRHLGVRESKRCLAKISPWEERFWQHPQRGAARGDWRLKNGSWFKPKWFWCFFTSLIWYDDDNDDDNDRDDEDELAGIFEVGWKQHRASFYQVRMAENKASLHVETWLKTAKCRIPPAKTFA